MKRLFLDVETTGLDPVRCGLWQIAASVHLLGKPAEKLVFEFAPFPGDLIQAAALAVNGKTIEGLRQLVPAQEGFKTFKNLLESYVDPFDPLDKFVCYAYNAPFDLGFLRAWFEKNGSKYLNSYFWHPPIDVMVLAAEFLREERASLPNFKQGTVARYLGLEFNEGALHDALADLELMERIYERVTRAR